MYSQTTYLKAIEELSLLTEQYLASKLSKIAFKKASGGLGVYAEDCATRFMTRIRIPCGIVSIDLLRTLYDWAMAYDLKSIHITTRQSIQFHSLTHPQMIDLLKKTIAYGLPTKGVGGNFPRNVAVSPLSGVTPHEPFDVIPYTLQVNHYFETHMFDYHLPRKLKVSFSNEPFDLAHSTIQDMGFYGVLDEGKPAFKLYLGGGLGRHYRKGILYPHLVPAADVLYYVEALLQLFIAKGNYDNASRARLRYLVEDLGETTFLSLYTSYVQRVYKEKVFDSPTLIPLCTKEGCVTEHVHPRLIPQKQFGLYSVYVHPIGGQLSIPFLQLLLDAIEPLNCVTLRLAMEEGFYLINLTGPEALHLIELTEPLCDISKASHSVACIGKPLCQMGILQPQPLLSNILHTLHAKGYTQDILPAMHFSGCPNSCGTHQISLLGFMGLKKSIDGISCNVYEVFINGCLQQDEVRLAVPIGYIKEDDVPDLVCWLYEECLRTHLPFESWLSKYTPLLKTKLF